MTAAQRLRSIDILRGAIMVLMAIDHVRVYSGVPAGGPDPAVFFTRWVTHFCAPGFVFFAGTAAFLRGQRRRDRAELSRWLAVRGVWLVALELVVMRLSWTFNLDFSHYLLAGVLWVIGLSLLALAALVWLPVGAVAAFGLAVLALHNLTDRVQLAGSPFAASAVGKLLYFGMGASVGPLVILYTLVPWVGVIAAGYAFGALLQSPRWRSWCLLIGVSAIAAFVVLRGFDLYGDPRPWRAGPPQMPAALRFLNTTKYPASLSFLLMTLGPLVALVPVVEGAGGVLSRALEVFGRAPLFYYLLHIPLIHLSALLVSFLREGHVDAWLFQNHPMRTARPPAGYTWSLPLLYLVTALVVFALVFPCRWYGERKARRRSWLTSLL